MSDIFPGAKIDVVDHLQGRVVLTGEVMAIQGQSTKTILHVLSPEDVMIARYATDSGLLARESGFLDDSIRSYRVDEGPFIRRTDEYYGKSYTYDIPRNKRAYTLETLVNLGMIDPTLADDGTYFPVRLPAEPLPQVARLLLP